jgi:hypothetical protein
MSSIVVCTDMSLFVDARIAMICESKEEANKLTEEMEEYVSEQMNHGRESKIDIIQIDDVYNPDSTNWKEFIDSHTYQEEEFDFEEDEDYDNMKIEDEVY